MKSELKMSELWIMSDLRMSAGWVKKFEEWTNDQLRNNRYD